MAEKYGKRINRSHQLAVLFLAVAGSAGLAPAALINWNGNGSNANWTTGANWGGTAPVAGDSLFFHGTKNLSTTNDYAEATSFGSIYFDANSGAFTLAGNGISLSAGTFNLDDRSTVNAQTINLNMSSTASVSVTSRVVAGGVLNVGGSISGNNVSFQVYYDNVTNGAPGTTKMSGALNVTAITTRGGTLVWTNTSSTSTSGAVNLGGGSIYASKVDIQGGTHTFGTTLQVGLSTSAAATVTQEAGTVTVGSTFSGNTGLSTNAEANSYTISGGTLNLNGNYQGAIGGNSTNSGWLLHVNGGTVNMNAKNTQYVAYDGNGTLQIDSGAVNAASTDSIGNPLSLALTKNSTANGVIQLNGGLLKVNALASGTGTSTVNFNGGTLQGAGSTATFLTGLTAAHVQHGGAVIDTNGFDVTIAQNLLSDPGTGNTKDGGLIKHGSGKLMLSGAGNTYNGDTTVEAGTLQISSNFLADDSTITIADGAVMNLAFTGTDIVGGLILNGIAQADGVYGLGQLGSAFFGGTGTITVAGAVPEPASMGLLAVGGVGVLLSRLRRTGR